MLLFRGGKHAEKEEKKKKRRKKQQVLTYTCFDSGEIFKNMPNKIYA